MNCGATAHVNFNALQHNLQQVKKFAPHSTIMAMIKSNGYGHNLLRVANSLNDADAFGVACAGEGLFLRKSGISKRIVLMRGFNNAEELSLIATHGLDTIVHNMEQLTILEQTKIDKTINVWLKIDTGMHRLGFLPEQFATAYEQLQNNQKVKKPIHIMTHLADADDTSKPTTDQQLAVFAKLTANLSEPKSIANSAGIISWQKSHADWVRPGLMLYGVSPLTNNTAKDFDLQPVMTLQSEIIAVKHIKKGAHVGYGGIWRCPEDMPIGVISVGYGDGYPRHANNNGTPVLVNGIECPLVGRVSMDMITVDLRNNPTAKCGDSVTLWGNGLPIEQIAKYADTIPYELLCGVTQRVKFVYKC